MKSLQRWIIGWSMLVAGLLLIVSFGFIYWNLNVQTAAYFARRNARKSK